MSVPDSPVTLDALRRMAWEGKDRFAGLTAYDATFARVLDACGVEFILVGDSLGMVVQGHPNTRSVTLDDMVYHTQCVARHVRRALLVSDLPYMSCCDVSTAQASAARLVREGGAQVVKLEASQDQVEIVRALSDQGIPVCAHLGLRPQSLTELTGIRRHGRTAEEADELRETALALEEAGADLLLLECVVDDLAAEITEQAGIPVIGIGSGAACDGQVLVLYDLLGLTDPAPKHARSFMGPGREIADAVRAYVEAVHSGSFP